MAVDVDARGRLLSAILLGSLLVLTLVAFGLTRAARTADDVVNTVRLSEFLSPGQRAEVRFRLTKADEAVDVLIVNSDGDQVRALALGEPLAAGKHRYGWDGTGDDNSRVAPGEYRLRVILGEQDRDIEPPGTTTVLGSEGP